MGAMVVAGFDGLKGGQASAARSARRIASLPRALSCVVRLSDNNAAKCA